MKNCNLCSNGKVESLIPFGDHPIAHRFLDRLDAEEKKYSMHLGLCRSCGHLQLIDPVPPHLLYEHYVTLSSWKNHPHVPTLMDKLERLPGITHDSSMIEVGSNDGVFLAALRDRGFKRLLGVEPAKDAQNAAKGRGIETLGDYLTPAFAQEIVEKRGQFDLLICRHVLEHIQDLTGFQKAFQTLLKPGGHALFEVPDFGFCMKELDYSGMWEEHVNYYTEETFRRLLSGMLIQVDQVERYRFSGTAMVMWGTKVEDESELKIVFDSGKNIQAAEKFRDSWKPFVGRMEAWLKEQKARGKKLSLYGAGCRTCSFLNLSGMGSYFDYIYDDQPDKQGLWMPGSRLPVVSGNQLSKEKTDVVLLGVNAENEEKVIKKQSSFKDSGGVFYSIHPPTDHLAPFWNINDA